MPLPRKGKSKAAISANIKFLMEEEGVPQDEAVSRALRAAGVPRKKKKRSKT